MIAAAGRFISLWLRCVTGVAEGAGPGREGLSVSGTSPEIVPPDPSETKRSGPVTVAPISSRSISTARSAATFTSMPKPLAAAKSNAPDPERSEEHTSELQSLMRISYAVFCLKKQKQYNQQHDNHRIKKHNIKK